MIGLLAKVCVPHCTAGDGVMVVGVALACAVVLGLICWALLR